MRKLILNATLLALATTGSVADARVFEVADGNYNALRQAIQSANETAESDSILLAEGSTYQPGGSLDLPPISAPLRIYGRNATIDGQNASGARLFNVNQDISLIVSDLNILNVSYDVSEAFYSGGVIKNDGNTLLRNVTIANTAITVSSGSVLGGVIANAGSLNLANTTISGNTVDGPGDGAAIRNSGSTSIENSTITDNEITGADEGDSAAISASASENVSALNAIIAGNPGGDCNIPITSNGGNVDSDTSCGLDQASDQSGVNPQLMALADNGGRILTHALRTDSPAIDAGIAQTCSPMDARGVPRPRFGTNGAGQRCDSGAFERRNNNPSFNNSVTGSWFDSSQSGHGFMLEKLPGNLILITWFVFDSSGNRDWVQAIGQINDGIAKLTAYRIEDGKFPPAFDPEQTKLRYWGNVSLVVNGCNSMAAAWTPDLFGYSDGGMPLTRLTSVAGLSCN